MTCRNVPANTLTGRMQRRREVQAAQQAARGRKVTLMRAYRYGELPDIQKVFTSSFLLPLGRDPQVGYENAVTTQMRHCRCLSDKQYDHGLKTTFTWQQTRCAMLHHICLQCHKIAWEKQMVQHPRGLREPTNQPLPRPPAMCDQFHTPWSEENLTLGEGLVRVIASARDEDASRDHTCSASSVQPVAVDLACASLPHIRCLH